MVVVLIVFGPNRLPEVAKSMGKAVNEFKKATASAQKVLSEVTREFSEQQPVSTISTPEELVRLAQTETQAELKTEAEVNSQPR
jgi:sec-independent protein translocase protein TatA